MHRLVGCTILLLAMLSASPVVGQAGKAAPVGYVMKLPIPDYPIPCDFNAWKGSFQITKATYDKDENRVALVVKALRPFAFTDDGFGAPFRFYDEEGVNMVPEKNLKFDGDLTKLKPGEMTRVYLSLPDEDTLKKTKSGKAILLGFFTKAEK